MYLHEQLWNILTGFNSDSIEIHSQTFYHVLRILYAFKDQDLNFQSSLMKSELIDFSSSSGL